MKTPEHNKQLKALLEIIREITEPLWERPQGNLPSKGEWAAIIKIARKLEEV